MISWVWPWMFVLLPVPWVIQRFLKPAEQVSGSSLRIPFFQDIMAIESSHTTVVKTDTRNSWNFWLGILAWVCLLVAAARPQWIGDPVALPVSGRDLMVAVDVSGSMEIPDFSLEGEQANRLMVVKAVAGEFIRRRQGDRVGLVLFGSQAYVQTPLTFDRRTVQTMLNEAEIGIAGKETAIGNAIGLVTKQLKNQVQENRVLILLTDGANTTGEINPLQAASLAAEEGIRIYTIGVGADRMEVPSLFGNRTVNPSKDLDEGTLREVAKLTDGIYLRAKNTQQLDQVYQQLDELEPAVQEAEFFRPTDELYPWPLGLALILSFLITLSFIRISGLWIRRSKNETTSHWPGRTSASSVSP